MSHDEVSQLKKQLEQYHEDHAKAHEDMMLEIRSLNAKVEPISAIYISAQGFGNVMIWVTKWLITPLIVVLGALLTAKQLK